MQQMTKGIFCDAQLPMPQSMLVVVLIFPPVDQPVVLLCSLLNLNWDDLHYTISFKHLYTTEWLSGQAPGDPGLIVCKGRVHRTGISP